MKRRDFLRTPALGVLLPGAMTLNGFSLPPEVKSPSGVTTPDEKKLQQKMHPDFITFFDGIEYFFVGNGDIVGAIQYSPKDSQASFLGFTLMNPEHFCRKWSTFLYHPERGFGATKLGVTIGEKDSSSDSKSGMYTGVKGYSATRENFTSIGWKHIENIPVVSLKWKARECEVEEEFFVPSEGAILFRRVNVKNTAEKELDVKLSLSLYANFGLFDEIFTDEKKKIAQASGLARMRMMSTDKNTSVAGRYDVRVDVGTLGPHETKQAMYVYAIEEGERILKKKGFAVLWNDTRKEWNDKSRFVSGNEILDHLFKVSEASLKAAVARSGKMDAGPWMYNMEWLMDQMLAAEALLRCGFVKEARTIVERNLKTSIGVDGRTIESSRWFGYEYTEINQNGALLHGVWSYLCWTGDYGLVRKYWDKIKLCGNFPLLDVFLDKTTKMVKNKREFWERSDSYGIEDGYELAYQTQIVCGLEKGALIARALGDKKLADKWTTAAADMKRSMFADPKFKLIEDGHLIKRRKADGTWQRYITPPDRNRMPPGSPIATEEKPSTDPDATEVLPILYEMIDPKGELSMNTLRWVEGLWNQQWEGGGYPRYNVTSEDNPPAPWPIASLLIARAYAEAGDDEKVWRVLEWLNRIHGGRSGGWFERYAHSITPPMPPVSVVCWIWYEILALVGHHILGFRPQLDRLVLRPRLLKKLDEVTSTHTIRGCKIDLVVKRSKERSIALVNGKEVPLRDGALELPYPKERHLSIDISLVG